MAKRTLEDLSRQYNSSVSAGGPRGPMGGGPRGGRHGGMGGKPKDARKVVARLFAYISAYKFRLLIVLVFMLLNTVCSLAGSYMLRPIINNYIAAGRLEGFLYALLVLAGVYLCGAAASYMQARLMLII